MGEFSKYLISDPVTVFIIDAFEIINIDEGHNKRDLLADRQSPLLFESLEQITPVIQPRQFICDRQFFDTGQRAP